MPHLPSHSMTFLRFPLVTPYLQYLPVLLSLGTEPWSLIDLGYLAACFYKIRVLLMFMHTPISIPGYGFQSPLGPYPASAGNPSTSWPVATIVFVNPRYVCMMSHRVLKLDNHINAARNVLKCDMRAARHVRDQRLSESSPNCCMHICRITTRSVKGYEPSYM